MIYVSIVSHGHFSLIKEIGCLVRFKDSNQIKIIVRDNIREVGFDIWCHSLGFIYEYNGSQFGFGKNNNLNFLDAELDGCSENDYFLVMNPDVDCSEESVLMLAQGMVENKAGLGTLNLFLDSNLSEFDHCVRQFPGIWDFISRILFGINKTIIDKNDCDPISYVDWVAGSFMMFTYGTYKKLNGFDEKYFMYCEDIDICSRYLKEYSSRVIFFKDIYGVHLLQKQSRKIFSHHFLWHFKSVVRYLLKEKDLIV